MQLYSFVEYNNVDSCSALRDFENTFYVTKYKNNDKVRGFILTKSNFDFKN